MMTRQTTLLVTLIVALLSSTAVAFRVGTAQVSSGFHGTVLMTPPPPPPSTTTTTTTTTARASFLTMKKGKANVPPQMRQQYKRQQEMQAQREEMMNNMQQGADGLPVFNLFIRTPRNNMWYPCGSFKGDDRSMALCKTVADNGFMSGMAKNQLDTGIAGSLFRDAPQLKESLVRAYPQLRKQKDDLKFGYKVSFDGLEDMAITEVEPKEMKGALDNIKGVLGL